MNWYEMHFYECLNIFLKHFAEKSPSVFEGLKGAPSNTVKLFSTKCFFNFFPPFMKNVFDTNSEFFPQKYARSKIERHFLL
jgi:hypothetical protein